MTAAAGSADKGPAHLETDKLSHEPARMMVMAHLFVVDEADFVYLIHHTGLTWGNLSTHLTKLEQGGYVDVQKSFAGKKPRTTLRLTKQGRDAFSSYRRRMQRMLDESAQ